MKVDPYSTHQSLLVSALLASSGPVIELGGGYYSTPLLSTFAHYQQRPIYTLETNEWVYDRIKSFESKFHRIHIMPGFRFAEGRFDRERGVDIRTYIERQQTKLRALCVVHRHWGLVFIDHAPGFLRSPALEFFADKADFVSIHDSEHVDHYNLKVAFAAFQYRYDFSAYRPNTTILSNFRSCDQFKFLPTAPPYVVPGKPNRRDVQLTTV